MHSPQLRAFGASLLAADGHKELRAALLREIRAEAKPLVRDVRSAAMSIPSKGGHAGPSLRAAIAAATGLQIRLSGNSAGVSVRTKKTPGIRKFAMAGRQMNRESWRHPVYGRAVWVTQLGRPGWFDNTTAEHRPAITAGVVRAVEETATLIAARARGVR